MGAAGPAARPPHASAHLIDADSYTTTSGLVLFGRSNPANPFIPRERCNIRPQSLRPRVRLDGFAKIFWKGVHIRMATSFSSQLIIYVCACGFLELTP